MTNGKDERRTLDSPDDINLPFFAYGIFKPGQLAYSKIKRHVGSVINDNKINYEMMHRDGVPILIDRETSYHFTKGALITFKEGSNKKAYGIISNGLLRKLYEWGTVEINGQKVNVIFGRNPRNGSNPIEDADERVNFNGKKDPFFKEAIELIERNLNLEKDYWDIKCFFELQMNYMLLWSAIDRYCSLKYNRPRNSWNYEKFVKERAFVDGINKFAGENHRPVFSTDDLEIHRFNEEDPLDTLYYYYTFRCNVVHRGKAMIGDFDMLETAARELLEIFKEILADTFESDDLI